MRCALWLVLGLAACGGASGSGDDGDGDDDAPDASLAPDAGDSCPRTPRAADAPRKVVVSAPYTTDGDPATRYRVLDLAADGALADRGASFEMGRSFDGEIAFTPDGEIGLIAQDDGTLGVFRIDDAGAVHVIEAAYQGDFYAARVVMDPGGAVAYVLDTQWRENGGGIYRVAIGCDGAITELGLWAAAKLPANLLLAGDRAIVPAIDWDGSRGAGLDVQLLSWADPPAWLDGADAFGDDDAIVAGSALTADGTFALIGDNSQFAEAPNRIAVVRITDSAIEPVQVITPVEDPIAILTSPHDDLALAVSGFGDAVFVLERGDDPAAPFALRGELAYQGARPALPGAAVMVGRGPLAGLVLIGENQGVRRVRFDGGGEVTDLGVTTLTGEFEAITGAIGVQP